MTCEWTNALGFAIVAASIIRSLFFEAFTIPTGSMEKTMRVGDYLFVNKMKYGAKLPQTPISIPFVHNRIPGTFIPSFVEWFKMDYLRLPGYGSIKRGDIMVFNWPVGDSVIVHDGVIAHDYYAILRNEAYLNCARDLMAFNNDGINLPAEKYEKLRNEYMNSTRSNLINGGGLSQSPAGPIAKTGGIATLPIDKKENYIKRCVGVGGDTLEVINNTIHINGVPEERGDEVVFTYDFYFKPGYGIPHDQVAEKFEIYRDQHLPYFTADGRTQWNNPKKKIILVADTSFTEDSLPNVKEIIVNYNHERITCSPQTYEILKRFSGIDSSSQEIQQKGFDYSIYAQFCPYYPNEPSFNWSRDNYGPLYIPKAGREIELTENNWILYRRVIEVYEGNNVLIKDGNIYINNELSSHYTFKQNYYWLMGDNRHGSADSRCWGFVPEDHVVGTASFVWFSKHAETGIRWDRIFSFVK
jgi:signal peptidase I